MHEISASKPRVAIVTRTKNREALLPRAINSVLGQTVQDWIHIIVNDGGNPAVVEQIAADYSAEYKDRLKVIHNPESLGMEAASNAGIRASDSDYICIHDDDDSWEQSFLEICLRTLENCPHPSVKGVVTHITEIHEKEKHGKMVEISRRDFDSHLFGVTLSAMTEINRYLPISFMFEREVLEEIGYFDEQLPVIGDWEFNIRFLMRYDVVVVKQRLANYFVRPDASGSFSNSVFADHSDHIYFRSLLINKHVRNDIHSGKTSLGTLLANGDSFHRIGGAIWRVNAFIDRIKNNRVARAIKYIVGEK